MSDSRYAIAPLFFIRMAGVPFEVLEQLATPEVSAAGREFLACASELDTAVKAAEELLQRRDNNLAPAAFHALRTAVRNRAVPTIEIPEARQYAKAARAESEAEARLAAKMVDSLATSRARLLDSARAILPSYFVFGAPGVQELLAEINTEPGVTPPRNKRARERERHLLLYLQRIAAKNDTFSEFGPAAWGTAERGMHGLQFSPGARVAKADAFLERWTAQAIAAAINSDPDARPELAPRLNPLVRRDGRSVEWTEDGTTEELDQESAAVAARCDGRTPAHALGAAEHIAALAERGILRWQLEVPALDPHPVETLLADIENWRDSEVRRRWLDLVVPLAQQPHRFKPNRGVNDRAATMRETRAQLEQLGATRKASQRFLYAAVNPIGEECFRDSEFVIAEDLLDEVATEAAPWIDLWRDSYAFIASRVAESLRGLLREMPMRNGAVPLPAFLRHCAGGNLPLTRHGLVAFAAMAFAEVRAAFARQFGARTDAAEWELTAEDCGVVRRSFQYDAFDEYTYPSADVQLSATSVDAVGSGAYEWILGELHPPLAILHHGAFWSCPDHAALSRALASMAFGRPTFHFGFFAADFTAHTTVRLLDALPELTSFVAPERSNPRWRTIAPADAEVYVDDATGDVGVRTQSTGEHLGSFARAWVIPLGFHPFQFSRAPHMPRLRCGKVIVQRQSWTVTLDELGAGNFTGISRDLVVAVERLRAARNLPRHVYVRPTEQALRRSGAEGRDKDTKPVYIDLESYLFLEIFHRWLAKAGELEVTEMLPDPEHLLWREADGRRTFELRTLVVPRP